MVKEISHLIWDRDFWKQGVLYISFKNLKDFESLVEKFFRTIMHSLLDEDLKSTLESKMNEEISEQYHAWLYAIKDFDILIVLDNWDDYMRTNESNFRRLLKDITQKVQNSKIILASQKAINIETEINIVEYPLKGLENKDMHKLIIPPNKSQAIINKEFMEMWKEEKKEEDTDKIDIYQHEFFNILNGNPLCGLLVSSNANSNLISLIF